MRRFSWTVVPVVAAALAAGCASNEDVRSEPAREAAVAKVDPWAGVTEAVAVVQPVGKNSKVHGVVHFTQVEGGVRIAAEIEGLKPDSRHAFHIHEFGDATGLATDGKSAGGHYNPESQPHGGPDAEHHHAGDLGNLEANDKGHARYERTIHGLTIAGEHDPIVGRSVIIHAGEDDFSTQPTGTTGDGTTRVGCGVIGVAKPAGK